MKSNEFMLDEAGRFTSWLQRKGIIGDYRTQAIAQLQHEAIRDFIFELEQYLNSISDLQENTNTYDKFNRLLESIILNEATRIEDALENFLQGRLENLNLTPQELQNKQVKIAAFAGAFRRNKNRIDKRAAEELANWYLSVSKAAQQRAKAPESDLGWGNPPFEVSVIYRGNQVLFEPSTGWQIGGRPITDEKLIQSLNKTYQENPSPRYTTSGPFPEVEVVTRPAGGRGAAQTYKYQYKSGIWTYTDAAGNEQQVRTPEGIADLNKRYFSGPHRY